MTRENGVLLPAKRNRDLSRSSQRSLLPDNTRLIIRNIIIISREQYGYKLTKQRINLASGRTFIDGEIEHINPCRHEFQRDLSLVLSILISPGYSYYIPSIRHNIICIPFECVSEYKRGTLIVRWTWWPKIPSAGKFKFYTLVGYNSPKNFDFCYTYTRFSYHIISLESLTYYRAHIIIVCSTDFP